MKTQIFCSRRPLGPRGAYLFAGSVPRFAERSVYGMIASVLMLSSAFAQTDAQFARANHEYAQGHFKEAVDEYEAIIRSKQYSANLFYNLGNAYFRAGDFGRAILNYQRTLALDRHHPESDANLRIVRDEARALELQQSWLERHLSFANLNQFTLAATVAAWVAIFAIAALIFARQRSVRMMMLLILSVAVVVTTGFAIYKIDDGSAGRSLAIVTGKDVSARLATADNASSVLRLPPGSEIKILSVRGDWIYAALPNDLRGWIPTKDAELVRL